MGFKHFLRQARLAAQHARPERRARARMKVLPPGVTI
jgi:hypothetical protein